MKRKNATCTIANFESFRFFAYDDKKEWACKFTVFFCEQALRAGVRKTQAKRALCDPINSLLTRIPFSKV